MKNEAPSPETTRRVSSANLQSVGILLLSVLVGAVGQLTLKAAVNQIGKLDLSVSMILKMASSPLLILALGIYALSALLWLFALMKAELSFAYPFLSLTYVVVLVGGAVLFHEQITFVRLAGFAVIVCGLLVIAQGERATSAKAIASLAETGRVQSPLSGE